ncbi:gamma-aminobutyrate transaminase POP2 [Cucumis melo var. makuwa]|uniref:Gamma-aminobutyrate transaminase POP2 n=1 Tax=Cucumis melo var. makuwa TaxID=1194695 RepID=A0A5A7U9S3_CUCMM|nr:gamma-aminobutyrate transaminase POP2 [Cucumis melo var. makuwa]TYJ98092.1 gamma-aminobutyrate transaminase POP2 [Cucumis melo var. makuwa]
MALGMDLGLLDAINDSSRMVLVILDESLMVSKIGGSPNVFVVACKVALLEEVGSVAKVCFFMSTSTISSFPSSFKETDQMFLEFSEHLNTIGGSSSVGDNSDESLILYLRWADVGREYIKHFFMLDFNDQAINRFLEHKKLTCFKEFRGNCHRHFEKYDPEQAHANPPYILVERMED